MTAIGTEIAKVAKAIASGIGAAVGTVVLALDLQPVDHQGIQYLTQSQWGIIVLAVLASYGITWRVPNKAAGLPGEIASTDPTPVEVTGVPAVGAVSTEPSGKGV